jgi:hypothetical protein
MLIFQPPVNGPDKLEFFQIGYRPTNGDGKKHKDFGDDSELPVASNQPPVPKVTNCATAVAASEIICCGRSKDMQRTCAQKVQGCGVIPDLDGICQSPVAADGSATYRVCGQSDKDQGIVKGSHMEDIATCLDEAFSLNAQWNYA